MPKFKVDENMPAEVAALLTCARHDAVTVPDQQLGGRRLAGRYGHTAGRNDIIRISHWLKKGHESLSKYFRSERRRAFFEEEAELNLSAPQGLP